ncbi:MAG TPA: hypothetical protein VEI97_00760, partial [bacterium]|nr:hypothetical protein [bacterium]
MPAAPLPGEPQVSEPPTTLISPEGGADPPPPSPSPEDLPELTPEQRRRITERYLEETPYDEAKDLKVFQQWQQRVRDKTRNEIRKDLEREQAEH